MSDDDAGTDAGEDPSVFPDPAELPDESVSPGDVDPFQTDADDAEDLSEFASREWVEATTARERVRAIAERTRTAKSASEIAARAAVAETTARTTLESLADRGIVRAEQTDDGTVYRRDPDWHLLDRVRELARADSLVDRIGTLREEVATYRERFDRERPADVLVAADALTDDEREAISRWRTARRDLTLLQAAYRFREARSAATESVRGRDGDDGLSTPS